MIEWKHKPVSYVGYGGVGAVRAIEHLKLTAVELRMAPLSLAVHIGLEPFLGVLSQGKSLDDYPYLIDARTVMFNQLVWWARALAPARAAHTLATRPI
jgi:NAD(P)H-dependent FMN reductase